MNKRHLPIATALLLLALAGCQSKPSVVGKWKGKSVSGMPSSTEMEKQIKKLVESEITKLEMEFKPDGTATMGGGTGGSTEGKYTVAGSQVTFTIDATKLGEMPAGMPPPKPINLTLSTDGKDLTMNPDFMGGGGGTFKLERVP